MRAEDRDETRPHEDTYASKQEQRGRSARLQPSVDRGAGMRRTNRTRTLGVMVLVSGLGLSALVRAAGETAAVADAAQSGDRDAVRALLKQAADVNAAQGDGMTALHWAALKNEAELAQTLLYAGANVRATTRIGSYTPLLLAAKQGNAAVLDALVKGGADINSRTANGTTPLMFAASSGEAAAVAVLLDRGADVNAVENTRGLNAAMFAAAADR